ncbi:LicD family-domain-containing protein [Xylaria nigripes]|nr:LicD family-domain-containing protein [Xylaria nigripes]
MRVLHPLLLLIGLMISAEAIAMGGEKGSNSTRPEPREVAKGVKKEKAKGKEKSNNKAATHEQKYFHEPGWDAESGHYDVRYFRGKVPYEEHRPVLRHLIRSYLTTFRSLGAETWLAHGSLLGWWWNGRIMPWDYDLDVQVSVATLSFLGERYNRSIHEYEYDDGGDASLPLRTTESGPQRGIQGGNSHSNNSSEDVITRVKKKYLLDVNPYYVAMTKGNGANVIDARWIDMSNGMFIDITGLRERDIEHSPGVWSCKNNHRYRTAELWPLRRTEFEGVEAWIPYEFDKVLTDEYGPKSLVTTEWAGHRWTPELKEWIKMPPKPKVKPPKRKEHHFIDENGVEKVIVYEEVVVEV